MLLPAFLQSNVLPFNDLCFLPPDFYMRDVSLELSCIRLEERLLLASVPELTLADEISDWTLLLPRLGFDELSLFATFSNCLILS